MSKLTKLVVDFFFLIFFFLLGRIFEGLKTQLVVEGLNWILSDSFFFFWETILSNSWRTKLVN